MKYAFVLVISLFSGSIFALDAERDSNIFEQGTGYLYCELSCNDGKGWKGTQGDYKFVNGKYYPFTGIWVQAEKGLTNYFNRIYVVENDEFAKAQEACREDFSKLVRQSRDIDTRMNVVDSLEEKQCKITTFAKPNARPNLVLRTKYPLVTREKVLRSSHLKHEYCAIKKALELDDPNCGTSNNAIDEF
jgi:hypothetical protein